MNDAILANPGAQGAEKAHHQGPLASLRTGWRAAVAQGTSHSEGRPPHPSGDETIAVTALPAGRGTSLPAIPTGCVPGGWVVSSVSVK